MLTVIARTQEIPPDTRGGYDLKTGEITVESDTYEAARADIATKVPEGWRVIYVRVRRD